MNFTQVHCSGRQDSVGPLDALVYQPLLHASLVFGSLFLSVWSTAALSNTVTTSHMCLFPIKFITIK